MKGWGTCSFTNKFADAITGAIDGLHCLMNYTGTRCFMASLGGIGVLVNRRMECAVIPGCRKNFFNIVGKMVKGIFVNVVSPYIE